MADVKETAQILLEKLTARLSGIAAEDLTPQAAKQASSALKDIRDLLDEDKEPETIQVVWAEGFEEIAR